jgi:hypothetical protein
MSATVQEVTAPVALPLAPAIALISAWRAALRRLIPAHAQSGGTQPALNPGSLQKKRLGDMGCAPQNYSAEEPVITARRTYAP